MTVLYFVKLLSDLSYYFVFANYLGGYVGVNYGFVLSLVIMCAAGALSGLLEKRGFLAEEGGRPKLCIPHLTRSEFAEFRAIFHTAKAEAARALSAPMAAFLQHHRKKIPPHLKNVPEQKLTMPYEPQPMMFVAEAIWRGLHPQDLGEPCPETIVVFD